jgi:hypothetical protein
MASAQTVVDLASLYEIDETAWLEQMAALAADGQSAALDLKHLQVYLTDMARRDKREVLHRLIVLLVHLLKWEHQPNKRSRAWELTIREQREELQELLESATLRNYANVDLGKAYQRSVRRAAVETDLLEEAFPEECPYTLTQLLDSAEDI